MRPNHRRLETAACGGLSDYPVTPSEEPGSADEALIGHSGSWRFARLSLSSRFGPSAGPPFKKTADTVTNLPAFRTSLQPRNVLSSYRTRGRRQCCTEADCMAT
jgi:hypothetical protein